MFKVRIQNFQSIKDSSIEVDGLTVVSGPNNTGKSAAVRAIMGAFSNASPRPLVRHGTNSLAVEIEFDDGNTLLWEKGKGVNRYVVNGEDVGTVGQGVPEIVCQLGITPISAGNQDVWPQFAEQIKGTMFLVDKPGSALAEAISDVERVGTLNRALKAAESDKRGVKSKLKIRREDLEDHQKALDEFEGVDALEHQIESIESLQKTADKIHKALDWATQVQQEMVRLQELEAYYDQLVAIQIPGQSDFLEVENLEAELQDLSKLLRDLAEVRKLDFEPSFDSLDYANERIVKAKKAYPIIHSLAQMELEMNRLGELIGDLEKVPQGAALSLDRLNDIRTAGTHIDELCTVGKELEDAIAEIARLESSYEDLDEEAEKFVGIIHDLLGDLKECPVCKTPH